MRAATNDMPRHGRCMGALHTHATLGLHGIPVLAACMEGGTGVCIAIIRMAAHDHTAAIPRRLTPNRWTPLRRPCMPRPAPAPPSPPPNPAVPQPPQHTMWVKAATRIPLPHHHHSAPAPAHTPSTLHHPPTPLHLPPPLAHGPPCITAFVHALATARRRGGVHRRGRLL